MNELPLIQPKEISINDKTFVISKIPTLSAIDLGAKVAKMYKTDLGNTSDIMPLAITILGFVGIVVQDGRTLRLNNPTLINNHIMMEDLGGLLKAMWEHNFSFLPIGQVSNSWGLLSQSLQGLNAQT